MTLRLHFIVMILEAYRSKGLHPGRSSNQVLSFEIEVSCEIPKHLKMPLKNLTEKNVFYVKQFVQKVNKEEEGGNSCFLTAK